MVLCYTFSVVLFSVGIAFFTGKAAAYIPGYVNMTEKEKAKINMHALCRTASSLFFSAAVIFALAGYSTLFRESYFRWAMIGWFLLCCWAIWFINSSKRYTR